MSRILRNVNGTYREHDFAFVETACNLGEAREKIAAEVTR